MLDRLEVYNFKSYKGRQTIGPFHSFTAVIGPNGAGKSNLMDAISFVLGVRSSTLRSAALKDLIYRSGSSRRRRDKGKGKAVEGQDGEEDDDEGSGEESEEPEADGADSDGEEADGERKAWVRAVYIDEEEDQEWTFQRSISTAGTSDYKLNGKSVPYKKYNEQLESFKILVKARNFLVFQGDVEQVASQSPKDLAQLIDRISGSLDYKEEYDRCATELAKATEQSMMQHSRRKGVNGEIKQYKEMKKEAERWKELQQKKEDAIIRHLVWKLFHIEQGIDSNTEAIAEKNEELAELRLEHGKFEEEQKAAKKEANRATKGSNRKEKEMKTREKDLETIKPELDAIDAKIQHAARKLKSAEEQTTRVERDLEAGESKVESLRKDLDGVNKAQKRATEAAAKSAKSKGIDLTAADVEEYRELRNAAAVKAVTEREQLTTVNRDLKTKRALLAESRDSVQVSQRKVDKLEAEESDLNERKGEVDGKVKKIRAELKRAEKELSDLQARRTQTAQTEKELNEKLFDTMSKLFTANSEKRETEKEAKFKETLASLKRSFPGVRGRVIDLCKPIEKRFETAVTTVLGRNIDSIVVDTEKTAIDCIEYMRVQRAGQATFVPLETIKAKPASDMFRGIRGSRYAIDTITYDSSVERAMQFACGNALVCDTMEVAKYICYERKYEVKAVTLDGTIIHRSGLITGGTSTHSNGLHFEDREVEGLRRKESELRSKLGEVNKNKPLVGAEDAVSQEIIRFKSDQTIAQEDLSSINARVKDLGSELAVLKKAIDDQEKKIAETEKAVSALEEKKEDLESAIAVEEDAIFSEFCRRIKVDNIRVYEKTMLGDVQAEEEAKLRFKTQIARLTNQIEFEDSQLESTRQRLESLRTTATKEQDSLERLREDRQAKVDDLAQVEQEIERLREEHAELLAIVEEKNAALDAVRKSGSKSTRKLDAALKEIANCNDSIERLTNERFAVFRRCKLDEIELPLVSGTLDRVPMDEAVPPEAPMDVDGNEDETQQALKVNDYGIKVDYEELDDDEEEDGSPEVEERMQARINKLQSDVDKMSPNLKAIERLGDSEARFREIDAEFDDARETVRLAKEAFNRVKKKRCELFNKAYEHISDRIDPVYKDLTKGNAAPMGGVAYLSLEDSEEPYLHGIKYHAMPPMKRFRDMDQLSGGERTMASLSLLFAIHSYHRSPFFVLDEVDAALDNTNVARVARYVESISSPTFQFIVISLKNALFERAAALVGIYRQDGGSKNLTLDLSKYAD